MNNSILTAVIFSVIDWHIVYADAQNLNPLTQRSPWTIEAIVSQGTGGIANGINITAPQGSQGRATLTVKNGTLQDAVVKLVERSSGKTLRFVYVRASHTVTIEGIGSYNCVLRFSTGRQWERKTRTFLQNPSFFQFEKALDFQEKRTGNRVEWMNHTVTLHPVSEGNVPIKPINRNTF